MDKKNDSKDSIEKTMLNVRRSIQKRDAQQMLDHDQEILHKIKNLPQTKENKGSALIFYMLIILFVIFICFAISQNIFVYPSPLGK